MAMTKTATNQTKTPQNGHTRFVSPALKCWWRHRATQQRNDLRPIAYTPVSTVFKMTTANNRVNQFDVNPFDASCSKLLPFEGFSVILVQPTISNFWHSGALALTTERQSARMSKIKNGGLDQYGARPFEQQQFGTAGVEGVNGIGGERVKTIMTVFRLLCQPCSTPDSDQCPRNVRVRRVCTRPASTADLRRCLCRRCTPSGSSADH